MALTRYVDGLASGGTVSWLAAGPGPPVVCVHGAGVSSRLLMPLVSAMEGVRETWTVDLAGFGRSTGDQDAVSVGLLADALLDWIDARGLRRPCLLGMSFGCQVVVEAVLRRRSPPGPGAAREPERPLVLIGPTLDPHARSPMGMLLRWLRNSPGERPRMVLPTLADYRDAGTRRMFAAFAASMHDRVEDRLPHVDAPTLVVRGERDRMAPQDWAEEVTRLLPRGRLRVVPGSAHTVSYRDPLPLARLVDAFIAEAAEAAATGGTADGATGKTAEGAA
ncbi:pimeloyl-ACP methyl ester carboxylesterase [Spinactinospora alkalitolerans]|uniref:Pimeloyl-ACP methyl ester carboxylesterase n=1 Tax=Spinactinospora alkalitolerans TaxID=687207 RepID=A0A852TXL0_9ACTN|nr:alpha/beta hydrolase [Spinactinospora alkalitolerans]NYE48095.1 pimeloyl-ACP methyl ester carboxylesterase [Spinactinospora alkalitolerans]